MFKWLRNIFRSEEPQKQVVTNGIGIQAGGDIVTPNAATLKAIEDSYTGNGVEKFEDVSAMVKEANAPKGKITASRSSLQAEGRVTRKPKARSAKVTTMTDSAPYRDTYVDSGPSLVDVAVAAVVIDSMVSDSNYDTTSVQCDTSSSYSSSDSYSSSSSDSYSSCDSGSYDSGSSDCGSSCD